MKITNEKNPAKKICRTRPHAVRITSIFIALLLLFFIMVLSLVSSCTLTENAGSFFRQVFEKTAFPENQDSSMQDINNSSSENDGKESQGQGLQLRPLLVYIDELVTIKERNRILEKLSERLDIYNSKIEGIKFAGILPVNNRTSADIVFKIVSGENINEAVAGPFYYALVTSFYSLVEEISFDDFKNYWNGAKTSFKDLEGNEVVFDLAAGNSSFNIMERILGKCGAQSLFVLHTKDIEASLKNGKIIQSYGSSRPASDNLDKDKNQDTGSQKPGDGHDKTNDITESSPEENTAQVIAIVPFEAIRPYQKLLKIEGINILDKNPGDTGESFEDGQSSKNLAELYTFAYAIAADFNGDTVDEAMQELVRQDISKALPSNRSEAEIASVIMTGVTALTRQVAQRMDEKGILYPAEKIRDVLLDADITHISNEVSFVPDCFAAKPNTMVFCSRPEYIELLKYIDVDVIELTGNHINDYGSQWLDYSLDMYDEEYLPYFGGGRDIEDALKPVLFDFSGMKFAFIGANPAGPSYAWATESSAGSAPVNTLSGELKEQDMQKYENKIKLLKSQGYIVIFTFQYFENYSYSPTDQQVIDFKRIADAGADIVSGSQAHQPQGFEITASSFVCYGLGNIFFGQQPRDASLALKVKQGIIAKHTFYKGAHINTELITTIIEDAAQPRLTTDIERAELLSSVFGGSIK